MPELPEVEITRRRIQPALLGRRIRRLKTTAESYFFLTAPALLRRALKDQTALELERHGKYLLARLESGSSLLLHLGMTGQLFSSAAVSPRLLSASARATLTPNAQICFKPDKHTHLVFEFDDAGPSVCFRDVRKFGKVRLLEPGEVDPRIARLGTDALSIGADELFAATRRRSIPIKSLLLDQSVLAGAGNIYADEALFLAKVRPTRPANNVTRKECEGLVRALRRVLLRSIETGGSSISDFVGPDGKDGHYQDERKVYARGGQPCKRCKKPIQRLLIGQRSTHFCRHCQR